MRKNYDLNIALVPNIKVLGLNKADSWTLKESYSNTNHSNRIIKNNNKFAMPFLVGNQNYQQTPTPILHSLCIK